MKSRIWLIAVAAAFAAVFVLPASVFAQETDTTRQARPDTLQQTPEETPADAAQEATEDAPTETPEEVSPEEMPQESLQETPPETPAGDPQAGRAQATRQTQGGMLRPPTTGMKAYAIDLSGDAAVPGPGADGSGRAFVVVYPDKGSVCYSLDVSGISRPTDAHIHEGAAGVAGSPVVNFGVPTHGLGGCVMNVDAKLAKRLADKPTNFYVNVHNEEFPQGALRGQLRSADRQGS